MNDNRVVIKKKDCQAPPFFLFSSGDSRPIKHAVCATAISKADKRTDDVATRKRGSAFSIYVRSARDSAERVCVCVLWARQENRAINEVESRSLVRLNAFFLGSRHNQIPRAFEINCARDASGRQTIFTLLGLEKWGNV